MTIFDLISFDIFDTLVHRRVGAPVDIFEAVRLSVFQKPIALLNHDRLLAFCQQRVQAEREAREARVARMGDDGEVLFDEIYDCYQELSGCSSELRNLLQQTELRMERTFLFDSPEGMVKFEELKPQARQLAFLSDMYLPSEWLRQLLVDLGFQGVQSVPIFVSGEERRSKHAGGLYDVVRDRLKLAKGARWLHVGDNPHADVAKARAHGIETLHAQWAEVDNRWLPSNPPRSEYLVRSIVKFLSQPQSRGSFPDEPYAAIGYQSFGPAIFGFMLWLLAKVRETKLGKLVFVARDGWLPFQLFQSLRHEVGLGDVGASYIHFSRQAGLLTGIKSWDTDRWWPLDGRGKRVIDEVIASVGLDIAGLTHLLERHGLKSGDEVTAERRDPARRLLAESFQSILTASRHKREKFAPYLESYFIPGERTGIVDIGWNGSIQRYLGESLDGRYFKEQFTGLFLGLHSTATIDRDRGLKMQGWLVDFGNPPHVQQYLFAGGVELLEFALTADHGTTLGFAINEQGGVEPVLEELQPGEAIYRERAMKVQAGIRKFVDDYRFLLREFDPAVICSTAWSLPFERLVLDPSRREIDLLADLTHSDAVGHTSSRIPLAARQGLRTRWSPGALARAREASFWKAAFDRLNR
ncbi:MAG: hypothetical protein IOC82_01440 [Aestuariivirga sp.]|uniref:HAD family hydrolase n=1 Tax=Aestuariivirga sp. TaxID=2650926 RepID=UPI0025C2077D|nr:hypothetical protein [Aestuariivirga sp.]MCA3559676.1 hypothetical protein [Aestuariivirga sp.]